MKEIEDYLWRTEAASIVGEFKEVIGLLQDIFVPKFTTLELIVDCIIVASDDFDPKLLATVIVTNNVNKNLLGLIVIIIDGFLWLYNRNYLKFRLIFLQTEQ